MLRLHVVGYVLAAAHVDYLAIDGEGFPASICNLEVAFSVERFDVEVLYVGVEGGESPGNMIVVSGDHERHSRQCDAGSVKAGRTQVRHVPDIRHSQAEVHVVGEQGFSTGGVRARDHPVVGAGGAIRAGEAVGIRGIPPMRETAAQGWGTQVGWGVQH